MNIRTRLALQFLVLASVILGIAFAVVYLRAADFRKEEFVSRMKDRGNNAATMLLQVDEIDDRLLHKIELASPVRLPEETITIHDHAGHEVLRLGAQHGASGPTSELLALVRSESPYYLNMGDRELLGFAFRDGDEEYVVISSGLDIYGRRKLKNQAQVMLATFLIGVVLIFFIGRFFAMRALSPVQRLVWEFQQIGASDLSKRIQLDNDKDELAQLALSFNDLLARLQDAFQVQRNFIANASHELRSPLTAISGQLEVLLLNPRTNAEYETVLRSVLEDMHALNQLSDRLLLTAQAETGATATSFGPVRMDEVLWVARDEVLRMDTGYRVDVMIEEVEDESDLLVTGNETLLHSMVTNLMANACKFADDHRALIFLKSSRNAISVQVQDQGPGIAIEDHERIFEPFYRAKNTGGTKGHGIGLSLVKSIVLSHGGVITLDSKLGSGSVFTVALPKAA